MHPVGRILQYVGGKIGGVAGTGTAPHGLRALALEPDLLSGDFIRLSGCAAFGRIAIRNRDITLEGVLFAESESGEGFVDVHAIGCKGPFKVTKVYWP